MRTQMKVKDRIICAFAILLNKSNFTDGTKALYCANCNSHRFEDIDIEETKHTYNAIYKCKRCGAVVHSSEIWKF